MPKSDARTPARRDIHDRLIDRVLETPHLAQVVPRLQPELLHRVIQSCGLEDCADLVALTTPAQLARVFDLDLWRAQPGRDEQFDAERFGLWLEVLVEAGAAVAAEKLAGMDVGLVVAGISRHARVFDCASVTPFMTTDGELSAAMPGVDETLASDLGGYRLIPRRNEGSTPWDAIVTVLIALDADHPHFFHEVMRGCRSLSNAGAEVDGLRDFLNDREQAVFDLAFDRERRRARQGYVTAAQARAFLQMSRDVRIEPDGTPATNPVAGAYFRAIDRPAATDAESASPQEPAASDAAHAQTEQADAAAPADAAAAMIDVLDILRGAGVLAEPPRALLQASPDHPSRLARIEAQMQVVLDRDAAACSKRHEELAYLANTMMAGCSIQARPLTAQEASDAAVAICNLGLENWPTVLPDDFLVGHELVSVFQVGWATLHQQVGMHAAERLIEVLTRLRCGDRETQAGLDALRYELTRQWRAGAPWRAQRALEVMAILDLPAWMTLLGLIAECPVMHGCIDAVRGSRKLAVSPTDFEFISDNSQIESIREYLRSLPEILR
jgi:hypothetical protein